MSNYKNILSQLFKQKKFPQYLKHNVHNLVASKKIILYGAGSGFITFSVFVLKKYNLNPALIIDQKFRSSKVFNGIPAYPPQSYKLSQEDKDNSIVIITIGKSKYHQEIFRTLRSMGFKNIILATDIYEYHLHYPSKELEEKRINFYLENQNKIKKCFNVFSDELSREIYLKFIQTHMLRMPITIPYRPLEEQYFPKDLGLSKKNYLRFIHCGAYHGETIKHCNKLYGKLDSVVCFEPDLNNFQFLSKYLCSNHNKIAKSLFAFPCGVLDHETLLRFSKGNETNSMVSEEGDSIIQCAAIDHVIPNFKPTFISMDIEGAELEALKGAKKVITENKPNLAISVYHTPNHIWDIPLYIDSLKLGYKFYLRNYTSFISETIFYAIMKH